MFETPSLPSSFSSSSSSSSSTAASSSPLKFSSSSPSSSSSVIWELDETSGRWISSGRVSSWRRRTAC
ncbi:unnamed protein product [Spirodela intermedia]|uniref:Uncharacterized protein n=2 Tax=Spirodela intermedia TaxID=51605 RepID=A0A7I8ILX0_SPIIN|nr:unnamed protein product [Spirodela intermedia]CAA6658877.1 unnamed protein product [Spirodela intermedia]CAA7395160.1 unnamed protein product [Spirodela intermedia]